MVLIGVNPAAATTPPRVSASEIAPAELARVMKRAATDFPEVACVLVQVAATGARTRAHHDALISRRRVRMPDAS
ncbi:MAG: hypothetical protein EA389_15895 [Ilumatobacter sp.]|nr:MAG: hypothetical protein EA389_15895 [Ilumatobacter sp.]